VQTLEQADNPDREAYGKACSEVGAFYENHYMDLQKAMYWYTKARVFGDPNARRRLQLAQKQADASQKGRNMAMALGDTPAARRQAVQDCHTAADAGDREAQYQLGNYYEHGVVVAQNMQQAMVCYEASAAQHYQPSIQRLRMLRINQREGGAAELNAYK
jgi:TPR repeat protein